MRFGALLILCLLTLVLLPNDGEAAKRGGARRRGNKKVRSWIVRCCGGRRCSAVSKRTTLNATGVATARPVAPAFSKSPTQKPSPPLTKAAAPVLQEVVTENEAPPDEAAPTATVAPPEDTASTAAVAPPEEAAPTVAVALTIEQGSSGAATKVTESAAPTSQVVVFTSTASSTKAATTTTSTTTTSTTTTSTTTTSTTTTSTSTTTTTPTTTKSCKTPSCETINATRTLAVPAVPALIAPKSTFLGSKLFAIFSQAVTLTDAVASCVSMNMSLLTPEDLSTLPLYFNMLQNTIKSSVWTTGSSEGNACDTEKTFAWCPSGRLLNASQVSNANYWTTPPDGSSSTKRCLELSYDATKGATLAQAHCSTDKKAFVCQPSCSTALCPLSSCTKNGSLFDVGGGALKKATQYGIWMEECGKTFLLGREVARLINTEAPHQTQMTSQYNSQVNWTQNLERCCSLGMHPISFTTSEEQTCFSNLSKNGSWKGNLNYWVGGMQGCKGLWGWCAGADFSPLSGNLSWAPGQPELNKSTENCMHMRVNPNSSTGVLLHDKDCKNKFILGCQSKPTPAPTAALTCPRGCQKIESNFNGSEPKEPFKVGDWYSTCDRSLFFPFHKATHQEAWSYCCGYGMKLLAVESTKKHACLFHLSKRYPVTSGFSLWTSGIQDKSKTVTWCSKKGSADAASINWASGQTAVDAGCLSLTLSNSSVNASNFALSDCSVAQYFVCEKSMDHIKTDADMTQEECQEMHDVSLTDMQVFKTTFNASQLSAKMKCFIKCMGGLAGMFTSGLLTLTPEALLLIENSSPTDLELQNNMNIVDECGNARGEDECNRAANIYQCGRERAPNITNAIQIDAVSYVASATATLPRVPVDKRFCRMNDVPCVVNENLKKELKDTGTVSSMNGQKFESSGKTFFLHYIADGKTRFWCHELCCSLGLGLAELSNPNDALKAKEVAINMQMGGIFSYIFLADVYVNGQNQDIWCRSNQIITDTTMYKSGKSFDNIVSDSCYYLHASQAAIEEKLDAHCSQTTTGGPGLIKICMCSS